MTTTTEPRIDLFYALTERAKRLNQLVDQLPDDMRREMYAWLIQATQKGLDVLWAKSLLLSALDMAAQYHYGND